MKIRKSYIFILLIALILLLVFSFSEDTTITLEEITTVKTVGADGRGRIKPELSEDKLDDLIDVSNEELMLVFETVKYTYDDIDTYSNGDKVKISCTYSEKMAEQYGVKLDTDFTYIVKDLKECKELDVFKDIEIEYKGASPYIEAVINTDKCSKIVKDNVTFELGSSHNLQTNEIIVVKAKYYDYDLIDEGYVVVSDENGYVVNTKNEYVDTILGCDCSELDSNMINTFKKEYQQLNIYDVINEKWIPDKELDAFWYSFVKTDITLKDIVPVCSVYNCRDKELKDNRYSLICKAEIEAKCNNAWGNISKDESIIFSSYVVITTYDNYSAEGILTTEYEEPYVINEFISLEKAKSALHKDGFSYEEITI